MVEWKPVPPEGTPTGEPYLLWREDWMCEDFNPTGVRDGWFQEGEPGEAYFGVARFCSCHDTYENLQLFDPAEWPTHYAEKPQGPLVESRGIP